MATPGRSDETLTGILLSSVRSYGFWSFVAAVVGVAAVAAGGIILLTIDELRNFGIGVLIIGLSLLFLALVLSPRAIALFLVGRQGRYGVNVVVMTVAFFAIAVLVNLLLFLVDAPRVDVTATRVFTLSPQTLSVLENLDSRVRANGFFIPGSTDPAPRQQADDLLSEFKRRSTTFEYRFVDPELNRTLALKYGVTQYPAVVFEDVSTERQQLAPAFTEQGFTTAILIATGQEQKKVYYLTGHGEASVTQDVFTGEADSEGFDFALQGMTRDNYAVRSLNLQQVGEVPEDAAVLIFAGPTQELDESDVEALTAYIKRGGRIIALLDPGTPRTFVDLLSLWGVAMGERSVADAISNVAGEMLTPLVQRSNAQYGSRATGVGITDRLDVTFFPQTTYVETTLNPEDMPPFIRFVPLALTTPASWVETNSEEVSFDPAEDDKRGVFFLAAFVEASGTVDESERHPTAKFVVFGDSDFAKNKFFYSSDNADFLLNSVNWLAEDFDLISIRPKLVPFRELVVNRRERDFIKWSSWFLPPSVMVLLGLVVWWRRR